MYLSLFVPHALTASEIPADTVPVVESAFYTSVCALAIVLLVLYTPIFKRVTLLKNLVIAGLKGVTILYFDWNWRVVPVIVLISILEEILLDCRDVVGDKQFDITTLPIALGSRRTKQLIAFLWVVLILAFWVVFGEDADSLFTQDGQFVWKPVLWVRLLLNWFNILNGCLLSMWLALIIWLDHYQTGLYLFSSVIHFVVGFNMIFPAWLRG